MKRSPLKITYTNATFTELQLPSAGWLTSVLLRDGSVFTLPQPINVKKADGIGYIEDDGYLQVEVKRKHGIVSKRFDLTASSSGSK